jgi:RNA polymerase sigma-70 factor, ECF subfamily
MTGHAPDDKAFESVLSITENRSRILAVIVAMVRDFNVAEDLFQETVLEILRSKDRYEPERDFFPWACGISKNVVQRYWKRENRRPTPATEEVLTRLAEIAADTDADLWREERAALQECLEKLPPRLNRLFVLRYGHNIKGQDLAERAGIRYGSVRTTLARLRTRLRRCIAMRVGPDLQPGCEL